MPEAPNYEGTTTYTPHTLSPESHYSGRPYTPPVERPEQGPRPTYAFPVAPAPRPSYTVASRTPDGRSVLTPADSASALREINSRRTSLKGINNKAIPAGQVEAHPDGNLTVRANDGRQFGLRPNGTLASFTGRGETATFRANGQVRSIHTSTMDVSRDPKGQRTVVLHRQDNSVVVSTSRRSGYVERTVVRNGRTLIQRSYVVGGVRYTRVYTTYTYHGLLLPHYMPASHYAPAFYGWAYYPWAAPAPYAWAWIGAPWYAYGTYFSVWPTYPSGAFWLTDYVLGQTLADGYQMSAQGDTQGSDDPGDGMAAEGGSPDEEYAEASTPITPALKQAIASEVEQQLAYENAAAANPNQSPALDGLPQVLVPNHLFVTDAPLNVTTADNQSCSLSIGNVLRLLATPSDDSAAADLAVTASRKGDCPAGARVSVSLADLQEMQNSFRARLDAGLLALLNAQGQSGLPAAPMSAIAPPPRPVEDLSTGDTNVQALLQWEQQQANQAETQMTQAALSN